MPNNQRLHELALKGLEAERAKIDNEIAEIRKQLNLPAGQSVSSGSSGAPFKKKRTMSAAARKKISESMKRRYAEARKLARKSS